MKLRDMKIETQLQIGMTIILLFVLLLGAVAWYQTNAIAGQASEMYKHPLQVRIAIGNFTADVLRIHIDMHDLMLSPNDANTETTAAAINVLQADAFRQIDILDSQYLGPKSDLERVRQAFISENSARAETIRLLRAGKPAEANARLQPGGAENTRAELVLAALGNIDVFARNKGDEFYQNTQQLQTALNNQLWFLVTAIFVFTLGILYYLLRGIRQPLSLMLHATQAFRKGDLQARSSFTSRNEFGVLSESYNQLAATIQTDITLQKTKAHISDLLLRTNEASAFFQTMLSALAESTGSQMAAVYLLSNDQKIYELFTSLGLDDAARVSFGADRLDGEFGTALVSAQIQHITCIPADTPYSFNTVSGTFRPREIITIPISSNRQTIAVISLATLHTYTPQALKLVQVTWDTLNARITGILAYRQIQTLAGQLEKQNRELEAQTNELIAQTAELNRQNMELEVQKTQLGEASRLKTSFISNMSHELRTPLNSVIALSGVLNRRLAHQISEEEYSYLAVIERNGKQLLDLINDILDLSRIEGGYETIETTPFDMNELVADVVTTISPLARQKNIGLLWQPHPKPAEMNSDANKCRHVLQNLIQNAVKFTEVGQVEISLRQSQGEIQITVQDTGIGISQDQLSYIFDEFRQADSSTSRRFGGTGLGLAIAKKYAQLLGGSISVQSVLGRGSVFSLCLPVRLDSAIPSRPLESVTFAPAPQRAAPIPSQTARQGLRQKTILLVEDSEPAIIQLKDILQEQAYRLLVARNGSEALEMILSALPDAMILDLMMPGVDGFEVLRTVREREETCQLPVLILTARHVTQEELRFLKHNHVYQLVQKGDINRSQLLDAVAGMVQPETAPVEKQRFIPPPTDGKSVVLVVEDNLDNFMTVKALLTDQFTILEAENGQVGIDRALQYTPHLILMDIALPLMDGIQAFKRIRGDPRTQHIPVIALTASAMPEERKTILAYGFDGYISKPIVPMELIHAIHKVLYGQEEP